MVVEELRFWTIIINDQVVIGVEASRTGTGKMVCSVAVMKLVFVIDSILSFLFEPLLVDLLCFL